MQKTHSIVIYHLVSVAQVMCVCVLFACFFLVALFVALMMIKKERGIRDIIVISGKSLIPIAIIKRVSANLHNNPVCVESMPIISTCCIRQIQKDLKGRQQHMVIGLLVRGLWLHHMWHLFPTSDLEALDMS